MLYDWPATPKSMLFGLASFPFARRYLGNRCFFLFLRVLRCFSSPGFLLYTYLIQYRILKHYLKWVPSFGNLRVNGYLLLTAAYRSLSRPSSAPSAKASALCSFSLDLMSAWSSVKSGLSFNYSLILLVKIFLVSRWIVVLHPLQIRLTCLVTFSTFVNNF